APYERGPRRGSACRSGRIIFLETHWKAAPLRRRFSFELPRETERHPLPEAKSAHDRICHIVCDCSEEEIPEQENDEERNAHQPENQCPSHRYFPFRYCVEPITSHLPYC